MSKPVSCMCMYQTRAGQEQEFEKLVRTHWPTLNKLELVTDQPAEVFQGRNDDGSSFFVEIFTWKDEATPGSAHELAEVMAIWEPMGKLCEDRAGRPAMEFPVVERIA